MPKKLDNKMITDIINDLSKIIRSFKTKTGHRVLHKIINVFRSGISLRNKKEIKSLADELQNTIKTQAYNHPSANSVLERIHKVLISLSK